MTHAWMSPSGEAEMSRAATIEIVSVSKIYGTTTAVRDISLKIPAGSYCCLLGPSGAARRRHSG